MITPDGLNTILYDYRLDQIANNDEGVKQQAIDAAVVEVRSYLNSRFDCDAIFDAEPIDPLVERYTKIIAVQNLLILSNVDTITGLFGEYYKAAIEWLKQAARGQIAPELPPKKAGETTAGGVTWGGNRRNNNSY